MTDLALLVDSTKIVSPFDRSLGKRVSILTSRFSSMWNCVAPLASPIGKAFSPTEQLRNELKLREMLPERTHERLSQSEVKTRILRLKNGVRDLVLESVSTGYREEISGFLDACFDAADDFANRAKEFDTNLSNEGIFQALRNIWITNSIQASFGMPVRVNASAFAYSLLYTYTDNFLDDRTVSHAEKEKFGFAFGRRLAGFDADSDTQLFSKVSELVRLIEEEYPRDSFPEVYASLLAIHHAQQSSLQQRTDTSSDILRLTVQKGGSSVLADGYLVKGKLSSIEQEFCFGYGVFLQLIDDLQDIEEDLTGASETLFTRAVHEGTPDDITMQLAAYVHRILNLATSMTKSRLDGLNELILQGSNGLILVSVALHPGLFSEQFVETNEPFSPLTFEAIRSMHKEWASPDTILISNQDDLESMGPSFPQRVYYG
jgi:hypothetical protein